MRKLYLFAGTNGVGKSTLYLDGVGPSIENSVRINADEIAREKGWDWRDPKTNAKALLLETKKLRDCKIVCVRMNDSLNLFL